MINKANVESSHLIELEAKKNKTTYKTTMNFLGSHKGLKDGKLHLCIGVRGGGKSTLRNTIMLDFLKNNPEKKIFLWLSEESLEDFETDLSESRDLSLMSDRILIFSEQDNLDILEINKNNDQFMTEKCIEAGADFFIYDNLTTSSLYPSRPNDQDKFSLRLKSSVVSTINKPVLVFAHTGAQIKSNNETLIDDNDIRGSKTICNISQFLYILQGFHIEDITASTVRVTKHRGHTVDTKMFLLKYDSKTRTYPFDVKLNFEEFNELYKKQNRLTRTDKNKGNR